jgi:hypothetical protein
MNGDDYIGWKLAGGALLFVGAIACAVGRELWKGWRAKKTPALPESDKQQPEADE